MVWVPEADGSYGEPIDLGEAAFVRGMNNQNQIVGEKYTGNGTTAVLWTVDDAGNRVALHELPGLPGYGYATPRGINDTGWIVGSVQGSASSSAVIWRPSATGEEVENGVEFRPGTHRASR